MDTVNRDFCRRSPANDGMDYLRQLGVDESEFSNNPGKFYVDVSLENNPEALLDDQLRESLRQTHFVHQSHKDNGVQNPDVVDFLNCAAGGYRLNNDVMTGSNCGHNLGSRLRTTSEEVERILLGDIKQLFPQKLDNTSFLKESAFKNTSASIGNRSSTNRVSPLRNKATIIDRMFSKTKTTATVHGAAVSDDTFYMEMCHAKRTKRSKKFLQTRHGCLRSLPHKKCGDDNYSTDDSDEHLLIPDIPLQHLLERMSSTEIKPSDLNNVCSPDGISRRTNALSVDRTTQTDSSAMHIHCLSNEALTYTCGTVLTPHFELVPIATRDPKERPDGAVFSGVDNRRHLVEHVCDDLDATVAMDLYHEDPILQAARAGQLRLLRQLTSDCSVRLAYVRDADDNNALHLACGNGNIACVRFLWKSWPDLTERRNHAGLTPAALTIKKGEIEVLDWIVDNAHSLEKRHDKGREVSGGVTNDAPSLLHKATEFGQDGCLRLLLERCGRNSSEVDFADVSGNTPAHTAARHGHLNCLQTLVEFGMSVTSTNGCDVTPLQCAVSANRRLCVGYLMLVDACVQLATQRNSVKRNGGNGAEVRADCLYSDVVSARMSASNNAGVDDCSINEDILQRHKTRSMMTHFRPANEKCVKVHDTIRRENVCVTCSQRTTGEDADRLHPRQLQTPDGATSPTRVNCQRHLGKEYTSGASQNGQFSNQSNDESMTGLCLDDILSRKLAMKLECVEPEIKHCIASTPRRSNEDELCGIAAEVTSINPMPTPHVSPVVGQSHLNQHRLCSTGDDAYSNKLTCSHFNSLHSVSGMNFANLDPSSPLNTSVTPKHYGPLPTKIIFTKNDFHETYNSACVGRTGRYS